MKKLALSTLALGAFTLTACTATGGTAADGSFAPITEGKLTVCTNPPYAPFEFEENGKIVGYDMDIAAEVAKDLGLEFEPLASGFEGIESGASLSSKQCDIAFSGITVTEERKSVMAFTEPYLDDNMGIMTTGGSPIASETDIKGIKVAVQQATSGQKFAEEAGAEIIQFEDAGLMVQALQTGQVDAVVANVSIISEALSNDSSLKLAAEITADEKIAAAVATENTALLDSANKTLQRLEDEGKLAELQQQWLGFENNAQ
ncbi:ABC transporter substrate-binding protein [Rothia sp. ZJ1223]|uniref:ABC transporter substrate-binding protein n=1 Tax=Rothia sp. ZJ1223 TaxID=2811098 RepID=UPI001956382F|nr:ABC transporter substrate-binding protein [Rothia sp. ZJ1223]MBM7051915.1 amino acid ABC transporter substrate-binding protein [Rothia sp. ZJ1223]